MSLTNAFGQPPAGWGKDLDPLAHYRSRDRQQPTRHCVRCWCSIPAHWLLCDGCKEYLAKAIAQAWKDFAGGAFFDSGTWRKFLLGEREMRVEEVVEWISSSTD